MQQEDDLRALAKIMEFGRAVSIFILVVHVYVYCYPSMSAWHLNLDVIDRILMNFDRTTGIFGCILWTKLMAVLLLAISCMGTIGVKGEKITWQRIWAVLTAGAVLFFMNWWLLELPFPHEAITALYVVTLAAGYLCLLMAGLWISRLYRHNLMEDEFTTFGTAKLMLVNVSYDEAQAVSEQLADIGGVQGVSFDDTRDHYTNASALYDITFDYSEDDDACLTSLDAVKEALAS